MLSIGSGHGDNLTIQVLVFDDAGFFAEQIVANADGGLECGLGGHAFLDAQVAGGSVLSRQNSCDGKVMRKQRSP